MENLRSRIINWGRARKIAKAIGVGVSIGIPIISCTNSSQIKKPVIIQKAEDYTKGVNTNLAKFLNRFLREAVIVNYPSAYGGKRIEGIFDDRYVTMWDYPPFGVTNNDIVDITNGENGYQDRGMDGKLDLVRYPHRKGYIDGYRKPIPEDEKQYRKIVDSLNK